MKRDWFERVLVQSTLVFIESVKFCIADRAVLGSKRYDGYMQRSYIPQYDTRS